MSNQKTVPTPPSKARSAASRSSAREEAWLGFLDILPFLLSVTPFALLIGSLGVRAGLSPAEITLMSATVNAGSAQFIALDMWQDPIAFGGTLGGTIAGASIAIILTTGMVNIRHILMGAALAPHVTTIPRGRRALIVSIHSDPTWALTLQRAHLTTPTSAYVLGMILPLYFQWVLFTALGAYSGAWLQNPAQFGFDFVFPAAFLILVLGFWRTHKQTSVIVVSATTALLIYTLIEGPWYIFGAGIAGIIVAAAQHSKVSTATDPTPVSEECRNDLP